MNLQMLKKWPARSTDSSMLLIYLVAGLLLFTVTDPRHVPPAVLALAFFILLGAMYAVLRLLTRSLGLQERLKPMQYNGLIIGLSALPVMLLALQSIGQLTLRDSITLVIIFVASYFYIVRQQN